MSNVIDINEAGARAKAAAKAQQAKAQDDEYRAAAEQFLAENPLRYAQKQNRYLVRCYGEWTFVETSSMHTMHHLWKAKAFRDAVSVVMEDNGWKYIDVTYTFKKTPPEVFNLMTMENWAVPVDEPHHWLFDVLMQSLGGNRPENIEHLERVIAYKYWRPETFLLPCIVIHGEGEVGKNLLVDTVLKTLFGGQTISTVARNILGNFNSLIRGRSVILINEASQDKTDTNSLKDLLHKEYSVIDEKRIAQFTIDNTPLYFMSSNLSDGGVKLDNSKADRRLSVMRCKQGETLIYWIAQRMGWSEDEAKQWMLTDGDRICRDKTEVGRWIWSLLLKYDGQQMPMALHGGHFQELMQLQKKPDLRVIEAVFSDIDFSHIERKVLYQGYGLLLDGLNQKRYLMSDIRFNRKVSDWLAIHMPHVQLHTVQHTIAGKRRTRYFWADPLKFPPTQQGQDNTQDYIEAVGYDYQWLGPEF